jgi:hypothetical protein
MIWPSQRREIAVHVLVEDLGIFGVRIQYWMLIAIAMVAVAIFFRPRSPSG